MNAPSADPARDLRSSIRSVPDFPKPGIMFRDITPLLKDPAAFAEAVRRMAEPYGKGSVDVVVGAEARGFILGAPIALALEAGFVPIRKKGKLPAATLAATYDLEYGTDTLEMHTDAVGSAARVLMVDDLLATGGTMAAACEMVVKAGGRIVGVEFLIELSFLNGRAKLAGYPVRSEIVYDSEQP
ncbi:MAG: adenine phosphoribosyltransferase [Planctomycetes bacterium]|nr:adenine phosphoribosyltransferase [Planctomycetota bacterium]